VAVASIQLIGKEVNCHQWCSSPWYICRTVWSIY